MRFKLLSKLALPAATLLLASGPGHAADMTLRQAVAAPSRSAQFVARDVARHPVAELAFFGVTPQASVVEIWPGGGYWTQILAPYLHADGHYFLATDTPKSQPDKQGFAMSPKLRHMLDAEPAVYGKVQVTEFGETHPDPAPPNSVDVVLTFRNLHNWIRAGDAPALLAGIHRALKTGGVLGIEDHRASRAAPPDPKSMDGYVRQDDAVALVEKAGFRLVGTSEIDANPRDTTVWPKGVWTLPPTYALGPVDHAKYQAIGEADNFVLKFVKVAD